MQNELFGRIDAYIAGLLAPEDDALQAVTRSIEEHGIPPISVTASQGKLLQVLALASGARRILEVGTLAGYSTIWLARALPAGGRLLSLEYSEKHAAVARRNIARAGLNGIAEVRTGAAIDVLPKLVDEGAGPFDFIFIDADKPPYTEYFRWALKLSRPGTIIVADNVIREGAVLEPGSNESADGVRRFNETLATEPGVTAVILQTVGAKSHDGMAIAVVR